MSDLQLGLKFVFRVFFLPVICFWLVLLAIIGVDELTLVQGADVGQPVIQAEKPETVIPSVFTFDTGKEIRIVISLSAEEFRTLQRVAEERNKRVSIDGLPPITWQAVLHESVVERIQLLVRDQP